MIVLEALGGRSLPVEIPPALGGHAGVPNSVAEATANIEPRDLVCWRDDASQTIGLLQFNKAVVLERTAVKTLSLAFMSPGKGKGWVELEVELANQKSPIKLLQSLTYSVQAVDWLLSRTKKLESTFELKLRICDYGPDY